MVCHCVSIEVTGQFVGVGFFLSIMSWGPVDLTGYQAWQQVSFIT